MNDEHEVQALDLDGLSYEERLKQRRKLRSDIVIIEDKEDDRVVLKTAVESCGYRVMEVKDSRKTINLIDSQKVSWIPEAVILNIILKGSSGYDLLRSIRRKFETKKVPIVVVSSMAAQEDIFEAQTSGANAFVVKPFIQEGLLEALGFALSNIKKPVGEQKRGIYVKKSENLS